MSVNNSGRGGGVKAVADAFAKNSIFYKVLPTQTNKIILKAQDLKDIYFFIDRSLWTFFFGKIHTFYFREPSKNPVTFYCDAVTG